MERKRKRQSQADGNGFYIPTQAWCADSELEFRTRAQRLIQQWRKKFFDQQGMEAEPQNRWRSTTPANPRYTIDFDNPVYVWQDATVTYHVIPDASLTFHYQDASQERQQLRA